MKYVITPYEPAIGAPRSTAIRVEDALLARIRLERQTGLEYRIIMYEGIGGGYVSNRGDILDQSTDDRLNI